MKLIPRDSQFYDMFAEIARRLSGSAALLHELFKDPASLDQRVTQIKSLEHEADQITHDVINRIDRTFVTPFDREDIHELAGALDDVIDLIDGTARRAAIFHITQPNRQSVVLSEVLCRAAKCIEDTVNQMKDPKAVHDGNQQLRHLEEEGDAVYHAAMEELFRTQPQVLEVIKWKELYDKTEDALDQCEDVGNVLQSISLKNA